MISDKETQGEGHDGTDWHQRLRSNRTQLVPRVLEAHKAQGNGADLEVVAVNDLTDNAALAHLLKFDSLLSAVVVGVGGQLPRETPGYGSADGADEFDTGAATPSATPNWAPPNTHN